MDGKDEYTSGLVMSARQRGGVLHGAVGVGGLTCITFFLL